MPHSVLFLNFFPNWPQSSYCCELSEHCGFISLLKPDIFLYSGHQNGQRFYHASSSDIYFENLHMWWELTYKLHVHSYIARIPYFHVELGWLIPPPLLLHPPLPYVQKWTQNFSEYSMLTKYFGHFHILYIWCNYMFWWNFINRDTLWCLL